MDIVAIRKGNKTIICNSCDKIIPENEEYIYLDLRDLSSHSINTAQYCKRCFGNWADMLFKLGKFKKRK